MLHVLLEIELLYKVRIHIFPNIIYNISRANVMCLCKVFNFPRATCVFIMYWYCKYLRGSTSKTAGNFRKHKEESVPSKSCTQYLHSFHVILEEKASFSSVYAGSHVSHKKLLYKTQAVSYIGVEHAMTHKAPLYSHNIPL